MTTTPTTPQAAPGQRAVIYARISESRDLDTAGIDRQISECTDMARRHGLTIVGVRQDLNISAYSGKDRPGFSALLSDMAAGRVDYVLAWAVDRLTRNTSDNERLLVAATTAGVRILTVQDGATDLDTDGGKLVSRFTALISSFESERKSSRTTAAAKHRALRGLPPGGARSFGYSPDHMELVPAEAEALREVIRQVLAGASIRSQAKWLNDQGLFTPSRRRADGTEKGNNPWNGANLRSAILRPALAGIVVYRGEVLEGVEAVWPEVISKTDHYRLVAQLSAPERRTNDGRTGRAPKYLLVGLAKCGAPECDGTMVTTFANRPGGRVQLYRCRYAADKHARTPGPHVARRLDLVDLVVTEAVIHRLGREDLQAALAAAGGQGDRAQALVAEQTEVSSAMAELATALGAGALTMTQFSTANAGLMDRLKTVETELAALDTTGVLESVDWAMDPREFWFTAPLETQRSLVDALVEVTILPARPGNHFDPSSVSISWKV